MLVTAGEAWETRQGGHWPRPSGAMSEAFLWGLLSASSLLLGGLAALRFRVGSRLLGLVMAFGAGVLISAVA